MATRFFVKPNFGHWSVIDKQTNAMVVGYSNKPDAETTAAGLNSINDPAEISRMKAYLKTQAGYGHYIRP